VFPVLAELTLPDRSTATVRVRRIPVDDAVTVTALRGALDEAFHRRLPAFARDVDGLSITLAHDEALRSGRIPRVEIGAARATLGEFERRDTSLRVEELKVVMDDVLVNPFAAHMTGRLELLDIGRIRIVQATIRGDDLQSFLRAQKRGRGTGLTLGDGFADLVLEQPGLDVAARLRLLPARDRPFALRAEYVRLGGITLPTLLVDWVVRTLDPSRRIASRLPMPVEIGDVRIGADAVRIVSAPRPG